MVEPRETNAEYLVRLQGSLARLIGMGASPLYISAVRKRIYETECLIRAEESNNGDAQTV